MTTNTTNSQATPEIDVEFVNLMSAYRHAESPEDHQRARRALVNYHEAKIAQILKEQKFIIEEWKHLAGMAAKSSLKNSRRAEQVESRLAEIQRGVEGLTQYTSWDGNLCETQAGNHPERVYVNLGKVLSLLQPQGQADTSGLPG